MATAVGLDIGIQGIKVAIVDGSPKKPRLADFIDYKLEPGQTTRALGPDGLAALIARIFRDRKIPTDNVIAAAPASQCLARDLQVPFTRDDQIAKTIKFQAESVFQSISIDDLIVEWYKLEDGGGSRHPAPAGKPTAPAAERSRLLVLGLKKELLRAQLAMLGEADLDPAAIDLDLAAIYNAWTLTRDAKDARRTLIVDLGGSSLKTVIIEGGRLRGIRSVRAQAAGIKVGEKRRPAVSLEDLKSGLSPEERDDAFFMEDEGRLPVVILDDEQSEIFDLAAESEETRQTVVEKIFLEIDRALAATRVDGPIEKVLLTGGGAAAEGIEAAFAEHFQAPCERLALSGALETKNARVREAVDLVGPTAIGLGLKGIGYDRGGLDFRKEEFTYAGKFERAKRGVACSLVLLFVFFFLLAYDYQRVEMRRLYTKQGFILNYQQRIYYTLFPGEWESGKAPPSDVLDALRKKQKELKGVAVDVPEIVSTLDMLRDIAQGFEESGKKFKLKQIDLKQHKARSSMQGEVDDPTIANDLQAAVNAKDRLVRLEVRTSSPNPKTGKTDVHFDILPKAPEKKKAGPGTAAAAATEPEAGQEE